MSFFSDAGPASSIVIPDVDGFGSSFVYPTVVIEAVAIATTFKDGFDIMLDESERALLSDKESRWFDGSKVTLFSSWDPEIEALR